MEVILTQEVPGLGMQGQIKKVKDGYARNYLIPNKFAVKSTETSRSILEKQQADILKKNEQTKSEYLKLKETIEAMPNLQITVRTGEGNKIYGTITNNDISKLLADQNITVDKRKIIIRDQIKVLGDYSAAIHLMDGVVTEVKFSVVAES